ncbi:MULTISPECIES: GNAT family N-acetyltransferase [unclassified Pseudomonas]|jgi:ribosomal-protein-alanine N-acetyltransferase|uniref:GNAT family N-acetyltransferase n=1 Tax=unclassified Pseudomonas TaxID=196821 RepID=UPI0009E9467C|nr:MULTISPECIES: GNAT family N-acetyltransferase [unclassified Pseudomonas]WPN44825.1 GNAT family N-acetyltransferase [Pseudomonas sp. P8_241]
MNSFRVRELERADAQALLAFEVLNRQWFESHIDARDPSFYSLPGVAEHIDDYLSGLAVGRWHPFVLEDANERIVGRANLKCIDPLQGSAEVGYRIDQSVCGQGLATLALEHLIREARGRWELTQLVAYVYAQNAGSRKVLDRCGFVLEQPSCSDKTVGEYRFVLSL